jgi:hypothetical protein
MINFEVGQVDIRAGMRPVIPRIPQLIDVAAHGTGPVRERCVEIIEPAAFHYPQQRLRVEDDACLRAWPPHMLAHEFL